MARDGWLQLSVMAKDCSFNGAVELCRNWDEFYELQTLTLWNFFPSAKWASWAQNALHEQLLQLCFISFHFQLDASKHTMHNQIGSKGRQRRQHHMEECRNLICGHMKGGDPVTSRFIDYCIMQGGSLLILVRDRLTGQIVTAPPSDERWIHRVKTGLGRASKKEWENVQEMGRKFFSYVDLQREWHFGFDSCYDVYVWDFVPGQSLLDLLNRLIDTFRRAHRITEPCHTADHQRHILENLTQDPESKRVRQVWPGEEAKSVYDVLSDPEANYAMMTSKGRKMDMVKGKIDNDDVSPYLWYNETDVVADEVLSLEVGTRVCFRPSQTPSC